MEYTLDVGQFSAIIHNNMAKRTLSALIIGVVIFYAQATFAAVNPPTNEVKDAINPAVKEFEKLQVSLLAKSKTYTDTKYGFTVTLPSTWKKMKATTGILFAAQPANNSHAAWLLTRTKYSTQKQADYVKNRLKNNTSDYGQIVLEELQQQFSDEVCTLEKVGKKTLGVNSGARANVVCTKDDLSVVFSLFSFVNKKTFYSATYVIYESAFAKSLAQFDAVTKTLVIK